MPRKPLWRHGGKTVAVYLSKQQVRALQAIPVAETAAELLRTRS